MRSLDRRTRVPRRAALLGLGSSVVAARASVAFGHADTDRRFVVVMLRGGLDGLSVVVPYGDPNLKGLRAPLVQPEPGRPGGLLDLGGYFGLTPDMPAVHALFAASQVLPVHAVAGPYRSRSHFEAQDLMEGGAEKRLFSGWLNRVAERLPHRGATDAAIAIGSGVPPLLRGPTPVSNWSPPIWPAAPPDVYAGVLALHRRDPVLGPAIAEGLKERAFIAAVLDGAPPPPTHQPLTVLADRAGRMLAAPDGPRLATLEVLGWDTHDSQVGRLSVELRRLDDALLALRVGLGDVWTKTVVLVTTEFGRTVRVNGSSGTDHGTASMALVLGGAVAGGRVRTNWPGLGELFEDRDLQPTLDIRSVAKAILIGHLGLGTADMDDIFPDSQTAPPAAGIVRI